MNFIKNYKNRDWTVDSNGCGQAEKWRDVFTHSQLERTHHVFIIFTAGGRFLGPAQGNRVIFMVRALTGKSVSAAVCYWLCVCVCVRPGTVR